MPHGFQIGCLALPTSFVAMIVHLGAEPVGAVRLGNFSQFPLGSPGRGSRRANLSLGRMKRLGGSLALPITVEIRNETALGGRLPRLDPFAWRYLR